MQRKCKPSSALLGFPVLADWAREAILQMSPEHAGLTLPAGLLKPSSSTEPSRWPFCLVCPIPGEDA